MLGSIVATSGRRVLRERNIAGVHGAGICEVALEFHAILEHLLEQVEECGVLAFAGEVAYFAEAAEVVLG